jgi:hypothetical protein
VSIKNKKRRTTNAYRLQKIEDALTEAGYICDTAQSSEDSKHWVDCVAGGFDISYQPSVFGSESLVAQFGFGGDAVFLVHRSMQTDYAAGVEVAIRNSRDGAPGYNIVPSPFPHKT